MHAHTLIWSGPRYVEIPVMLVRSLNGGKFQGDISASMHEQAFFSMCLRSRKVHGGGGFSLIWLLDQTTTLDELMNEHEWIAYFIVGHKRIIDNSSSRELRSFFRHYFLASLFDRTHCENFHHDRNCFIPINAKNILIYMNW